MLLGTRQRLTLFFYLNLMLYSQQIDRVTVFKYLGVMLDEQLVWKDHIDYVARKVSQRIGLLRRCAKPVLPEEVLKMLCCSLIMPLVDYCDVAWSNSSVTLLDKLIKLHNRMARMILNAHPRTHIIDMFRALHWQYLPIRWYQHRMIQVFKCLNGLAPDYLQDVFTEPSHPFNTRSRSNGSLHNTIRLYFYLLIYFYFNIFIQDNKISKNCFSSRSWQLNIHELHTNNKSDKALIIIYEK